MKHTSIYLLVLVIFFIAACSTGRIYINVLQPAEFNLPAAIQRISIFPGAGLPDEPGEWDSLRHIDLETDYNYNRIKRGYIFGLYDVISKSPRFQKVVIADTAWENLLDSGFIRWDELNQICAEDSTDAVLILKKAVSHDDLEHRYYTQSPCYFVFTMINETKWAFYLPSSRTATGDMEFTDTISLEQYDPLCDGWAKLQDIDAVLYESSFNTGMRVATRLSPWWKENITRTYYSGTNREMRKAAALIKKDQWQAAAEIWNTLAENQQSRLAAMAAFNLALAWERDDALDQAWLWISYADSLHSNKKMLLYKDLLDQRIKSRPLLDLQMAGK
jgi:hypothetical protein